MLHMLALDLIAAFFVFLFLGLFSVVLDHSFEGGDVFYNLRWIYIMRGIYHTLFICAYNIMATGSGGVQLELIPRESTVKEDNLHSFSISRIGLGSYMHHLMVITVPALLLLGVVAVIISIWGNFYTWEDEGRGLGSLFGPILFIAVLTYPILTLGHLSFVVAYNLIAAKSGGIPVSVYVHPTEQYVVNEKSEKLSESMVHIIDEDVEN